MTTGRINQVSYVFMASACLEERALPLNNTTRKSLWGFCNAYTLSVHLIDRTRPVERANATTDLDTSIAHALATFPGRIQAKDLHNCRFH